MEITVPKFTTRLWQLRLGIVMLILDLMLGALSTFTLWMLLPIGILLTLEAAFLFVYLPKFFSDYRIEVKKDAVLVVYGVFIRTTRIMPYGRLVYTGSYATPLSRRQKLMGLSLRAARGVLFLPEIEMQQANLIINAMQEGDKR